MKISSFRAVFLSALVLTLANFSAALAEPRQIILFVANGMGPEHVRAGGCYSNGREGTLSFEAFPYKTTVKNGAADKPIPDAAAAGTAMATGKKVNVKILSKAIPGNGKDLETALESYKKKGFSTGLVSTAFVEHQITGAFAAHNQSKRDYDGILRDIYNSGPDVLLGGGRATTVEPPADYAVVKDAEGLEKAVQNPGRKVVGRFGGDFMPYNSDSPESLPKLTQMTKAAISLMEGNPKGMFLVVESARISHASLAGEVKLASGEIAEFSRAVAAAAQWAKDRPNAMILVTADLETGGLEMKGVCDGHNFVEANFTRKGSHTESPVPLYGLGKGAEGVKSARDNTDVYKILMGLPVK